MILRLDMSIALTRHIDRSIYDAEGTQTMNGGNGRKTLPIHRCPSAMSFSNVGELYKSHPTRRRQMAIRRISRRVHGHLTIRARFGTSIASQPYESAQFQKRGINSWRDE